MNNLQFPTYKCEQSRTFPKGLLLLLLLLLGFIHLPCLPSLFSMRLTLCLREFWPEVSALPLASSSKREAQRDTHHFCSMPQLLLGTWLPYWHLLGKNLPG